MRDLTKAAEARFAGRTAVLSELWTRIGAETFRLGDLDAAEPFLRRAWNARADAPVNEIVPLYLSEILRSRKDAAGARQVLLDFLAAGKPGTGAAIIRLGDLALMSGRLRLGGRVVHAVPRRVPDVAARGGGRRPAGVLPVPAGQPRRGGAPCRRPAAAGRRSRGPPAAGAAADRSPERREAQRRGRGCAQGLHRPVSRRPGFAAGLRQGPVPPETVRRRHAGVGRRAPAVPVARHPGSLRRDRTSPTSAGCR